MTTSLKLGGLLFALAATASAEWTAGRGALQLDASLSGVYDSNINGSANNRADYYLSLYPELRYRQVDARFKTNAFAGVRIKRYRENKSSDSEDPNARLEWTMSRDDDHTTGADLSLSYFEASEPNYDINEEVRSQRFEGSVSGEVLVARRSLLRAGASYRDIERDIGSNQKTASGRVGYSYVGFTDGSTLAVDYVHQQSQSTDSETGADGLDQTSRTLTSSYSRPLYAEARATFTYGYRWLDRGTVEELADLEDRSGPVIGVSLTGPFLPRKYFPKTTGTFRIGYEQADVPGMNDTSNERLVGQLNLNWQARERTSVNFYLRRSQDLSITDDTVVTNGAGLSVRQRIGQFIQAELGATYQESEYIGWNRVDDRYGAHISGSYAINSTWSTSASYQYTTSDSNAPLANFQRHVAQISLTYAF